MPKGARMGLENYTETDYENDQKAFRLAFYKHFKYAKHIKEDLETLCLSKLWEMRPQFCADKGASYITWAFMICKQTMIKHFNKNPYKPVVSLNDIIGKTSNGVNVTRGELLPHYDDYEGEQAELDRQKRIEEIKSQYRNETAKQIIDLHLLKYKNQEIREQVECNRQYVTRIVGEFKKAMKNSGDMVY